MDPGCVGKAAAALLDAYATGTPIQPLTASRPDMSVVDAYAIQLAQAATWTAGGAVVKGHKVGLTSAAMQRQLGAVRLDDFDLSVTGCLLHKNGVLEQTGAGAAVLGSPINALVWLVNVLGECGVTLEAGHVVLPGSVTPAIPVAAGDTVTATFAGIGSVTAIFRKETP